MHRPAACSSHCAVLRKGSAHERHCIAYLHKVTNLSAYLQPVWSWCRVWVECQIPGISDKRKCCTKVL